MSKKYKPSVKANNELKEEALKELKTIIYKLEKGKYDESLDKETVEGIIKDVKTATDGLEYSIGTGDENVFALYEDVKKQIKEFKKLTQRELTGRIESAADELVYTLTLWKDVMDGNTTLDSEEDVKKAKLTKIRKKLNDRLNELEEIKSSFVANDRRLEKELLQEEKDLSEYESKMLDEENERKINDLYRKIKATKSKIDMLTVRKNNYSACYSLLDMIYANAKEILSATDFAAEEIAKVKVLLNIGKLSQVVSDPDKALTILKRMDKETKEIAAKTKALDEKVSSLDQGSASISEDALKYKEELMRKKREKEGLKEDLPVDSVGVDCETNSIKESK